MERNAATVQPMQETFMRSLIGDLNHALKRIEEIRGRVANLGDRIGGVMPEPPPAATRPGGLTSVPTCISDELRALAARAQESLSECEQHLGRIESFV